jgi:hypothetical protein
MLVPDVQIVKIREEPIPCLVGLYLIGNEVNQPIAPDNSSKVSFKFLECQKYWKLGFGADGIGVQDFERGVPSVVENTFQVVNRIPENGRDIAQISEAVQSVVDLLSPGIWIDLNPYCLSLWANDRVDFPVHLSDVYIGPIKL